MKHETKCSGIEDIITNIYEYFIFELNGSRHKDVLRMIKKNRGIITEAIMKRWIEDNYHKNYIESHKDAPYCTVIIGPKVEKLEQKYASLIKDL